MAALALTIGLPLEVAEEAPASRCHVDRMAHRAAHHPIPSPDRAPFVGQRDDDESAWLADDAGHFLNGVVPVIQVLKDSMQVTTSKKPLGKSRWSIEPTEKCAVARWLNVLVHSATAFGDRSTP